MGHRQIEAMEWKCDGCEHVEYTPIDESDNAPVPVPEGWLFGTVEAGPLGGDWLAHHKKCIGPAVSAALSDAAGSPS